MTTTTTTTTTSDVQTDILRPDKNKASGRLERAGGSTLMVKQGAGNPDSYSVAHDAKIFLNGQPATLKDLQSGMQVDLELSEGSAKRVDASTP